MRNILKLILLETIVAAVIMQSSMPFAQEGAPSLQSPSTTPTSTQQNVNDGPRKFDLEVDVPARNTIIEFNKTEGAAAYQVQIRAHNRYWAHNYAFELNGESPKLRIRLNPGQYALRTRSFDAYGFYGPWSGWQDFWIHYDSVPNVYPADNAVVKPKSGVKELLQFEWPIDSGAYGYHFILRDTSGKVIREENVKTPWNLVEVELSTSYSWTYWPIKHEKDFGKKQPTPADLETQFYSFRVAGSAPGTRDMGVSATASSRAIKYQFEFLKLDRLGERGSSSVFESTTPELKIAIAPGTYEARVRTFFNDKSISDWSPPWLFFVPYEKVKPIAPEHNSIIDPEDFEAPITLSWEPQVDVHHYVIYIYDDNGEYVKSYSTEDTQININLTHEHTYRWLVIPYSAGQSDIKPPELPDYAYRLTIPTYIPLALSTAEEPSHMYGWGRYYASVIDYEGRNYDLNSKVSQPIYGGAGEMAVGYWHRKSHFGLLVHGALSGFTIGNITYNYAAVGTHLGYRHFMKNGDRLRVYVGMSYTEFPEFLRDPFIKDYDFHRVKSAGPQLQVSYMSDFDKYPDFGWHAYGFAYRNSMDIESPNGLAQVPQLSYTIGIFGTYKYDDDMKWMLGYAYRVENIRYKSSDRTGLDNYSTTTGHYLNFSVEVGLSKQKYK